MANLKYKNNVKLGRSIEYKMPVAMAETYLKQRKGNDAKMNPNEFLCKLVNEEYGVLGNCVNVITY